MAPLLRFYPEDAGKRLYEARHARRWLHEVPVDLSTPSLRVKHQHFFTLEPVLLRNRTVCMPYQWFTRGGRYFGRCWAMRIATAEDGTSYWVVDGSKKRDIPVDEMLKTFEELRHDVDEHAQLYSYPAPTDIRGKLLVF